MENDSENIIAMQRNKAKKTSVLPVVDEALDQLNLSIEGYKEYIKCMPDDPDGYFGLAVSYKLLSEEHSESGNLLGEIECLRNAVEYMQKSQEFEKEGSQGLHGAMYNTAFYRRLLYQAMKRQ